MTNPYRTLGVLTAALLMTSGAYAEGPNNTTEYKTHDNGGYSVNSKSEMTTRSGTARVGDHQVDVRVGDDGTVTKDVKNVSKSDPDGLMNASKNVNESEYKKNPDGSYTKHDVSKHTTADGTNVKTEVKTDLEVNSDGQREKTVERTKTVDPKGLMNKTKETVKTVNGRVVD